MPDTTWIIAADHAKVRVFRTAGSAQALEEIEGPPIEPPLHTRDVAADRPGRTFDSHGGGRHAKAYPTKPGRTEALKFVRSLADWLDSRCRDGDFDRLTVVAPARMLGDLRGTLAPATRVKIIGELDKDYVNEPMTKIAAHLRRHDLVH